MKLPSTSTPTQICENVLVEIKCYNTEHNIWPSENIVIERLLSRRMELTQAYDELHRKLHARPFGLRTFFDALLTAVVLWSPEKIAEARSARQELVTLNRQIAKKAAELADLLGARSDLCNTSGFSTNTHYHVIDVIKASAKVNYGFQSYVKERLEALEGQFDLKYWPSLSCFVRELGDDAEAAVAEATDPLTAAATAAPRASLADFFKAFFESIKENSECNFGRLPDKLQISDSALASLANCALGLDVERMVDGPYVKRLRQRERESVR